VLFVAKLAAGSYRCEAIQDRYRLPYRIDIDWQGSSGESLLAYQVRHHIAAIDLDFMLPR
jgi:hypothetical protein